MPWGSDWRYQSACDIQREIRQFVTILWRASVGSAWGRMDFSGPCPTLSIRVRRICTKANLRAARLDEGHSVQKNRPNCQMRTIRLS